jgi:primosomal protein N'
LQTSQKIVNLQNNKINEDFKIINTYKAQILILFPEKKYLDKILNEFKQKLAYQQVCTSSSEGEFKDNQITEEICIYTGSPTKQSKSCVRDLVLEQDNFQIIFGTRASLFLPFSNLLQIILVDEANSMYIQDQGGLYYDTREAVFLLAKTHDCPLDFVSTLPSLRLFEFYQQNWPELVANYPQKPINTTINVNI